MAISFLIRCKGTTKNAHTQVKRAFFWKIIDLSIEYAIHIHDGSLLMRVKSEWHIQKAKPYFSKKSASDAGVCSAFCERTFGGIGKAKAASEGTTKNAPCAKPRCPHSTATTSPFFGGNPPFKGRGVPKKVHILRTNWSMFSILRTSRLPQTDFFLLLISPV